MSAKYNPGSGKNRVTGNELVSGDSVLPALWERDCYLISNLRNASGIKYFTLSSVKPFARASIRLLIYYMPEKVTKARALICTAVQIKNNDRLACSQLQPVTMK